MMVGMGVGWGPEDGGYQATDGFHHFSYEHLVFQGFFSADTLFSDTRT